MPNFTYTMLHGIHIFTNKERWNFNMKYVYMTYFSIKPILNVMVLKSIKDR